MFTVDSNANVPRGTNDLNLNHLIRYIRANGYLFRKTSIHQVVINGQFVEMHQDTQKNLPLSLSILINAGATYIVFSTIDKSGNKILFDFFPKELIKLNTY